MKLVQGVGVNDIPKGSSSYRDENNKQVAHPFYRKWTNMLKRCYDQNYHQKRPTYLGCTVCDEWKSLSKFKEWFDQQPLERQSWCLDKDLLFTENKVYSPETCILVPQWLNLFVIGCDASRGEYMIGVCWDKQKGKFKSQISDGSGKLKYLGLFSDELSAHLAWKAAKLNLVEEMKSNLDAVDERIYPELLKRYS